MKSMKSPPPDSQEEKAEMSVAGMQPEYPYGLRISLNEDSIEALGLVSMPAIGQKMIVNARVEVVGITNSKQSNGDEYKCVDLQITDMDLSPDKQKSDSAAKLYNGDGKPKG